MIYAFLILSSFFNHISAAVTANARAAECYSRLVSHWTLDGNGLIINIARCRASQDCPSFLLDYDKSACFRLDINTEDSRSIITPTPSRSAYFEKICLRSPACEKAWIFERSVGYLLEGYDDKVVEGVAGRIDCAELCLTETQFPCASAEYIYSSADCRLSQNSRRSQPASYRATTQDIDYIENQCVREELDFESCKFEPYEDQDIGYADIQIQARSVTECGDQCDQTSAFNCRSFTFIESSSTCLLSGEDSISAGIGALRPRLGTDYYQRGPCLEWNSYQDRPRRQTLDSQSEVRPSLTEVSLDCTAQAMTVRLNTKDPFTGRLYSQTAGKDCETKGSNGTETELTLEFDDASLARCDITREDDGVLSAVVVVQHHPVLQRKGDKAVQLYCFFTAQDKIVTNNYDVLSDTVDGGISTPSTVVNATAASPGVRLRIVTENGDDISGTRLGEKLFLTIEMEQEAIFGIFAKNLRAISGDNVDSIQLLDDRGCPSDSAIFGGLSKLENSNNLRGTFEAFKFSESSVVRFEVSVQFCVGECRPVDCDGATKSYGRRRRSAGAMSTVAPYLDTSSATLPSILSQSESFASKLVYDSSLGQEVIEGVSDLSKEIYVETGTTIDRIRDPYGREEEDDLVCTTMTVMIVVSAGVVLLQVSIIFTCLFCLYLTRQPKQQENQQYEGRTARVYHDNLGYSSASRMSAMSQYSDKTLQSLRTSLRD